MAAIMAPIRSSIVRILRNGKQLVYSPNSPNLIPHPTENGVHGK